MFDGVSSPVTQTFGLGLFEPATAEVLDGIERFFRDRQAPVFHEVSPLAGLALVTSLNERGYEPVELTSVMYRPIRSLIEKHQPSNEQIQVRPVGSDEGDVLSQTIVKGWSDFPEYIDYLQDMTPVWTNRKGGVSFLAELEGRPIAAGMLSLAGACTIPE